MGQGIKLAGDGVHAAVLEDFKDQLLIVFLKRLRAYNVPLIFPVAEVDDTGDDLVSFRVDENRVFHFTLSKKS